MPQEPLNGLRMTPGWPRMAPGALNGAPANKTLNQKVTISGPSPTRATSGALANKTLNKKVTIWGPSPAGAASGAPANRILNKNVTISGSSPARALLVLLLIRFLIRK